MLTKRLSKLCYTIVARRKNATLILGKVSLTSRYHTTDVNTP